MWTEQQLDRLLRETEGIKNDPEAEQFAQSCRSLVAEVRRLRGEVDRLQAVQDGFRKMAGILR